MPSTTGFPAIPYSALTDASDIVVATQPGFQRIDDLIVALLGVPIGTILPYAGSALPTLPSGVGTRWDWADGALISRITYAAFFTAIGHDYNGGVDPGSNQVRKPDKRGRVPVGADNYGQGAAGRLPNSNRLRGQNGGEERHTNTAGESGVPAHSHPDNITYVGRVSIDLINTDGSVARMGDVNGGIQDTQVITRAGGGVQNNTTASASSAHNNLQPYECDNYIVRIA